MSYASVINNLTDFAGSGEEFDDWLDITHTWSKLFLRPGSYKSEMVELTGRPEFR